MSTRQDVIGELVSRVEDISIVNGYQTDAGLTLFVGATRQLGPDDPNTAICVLVRDDAATDLGGDVSTTLPVECQAIGKVTLDAAWLTVEAIIADIRKAIETGDRTLDGLLTRDLVRGRTRALPRDPGSTQIGAGVEYRATFLESWNA
jgi:hypothetical protein